MIIGYIGATREMRGGILPGYRNLPWGGIYGRWIMSARGMVICCDRWRTGMIENGARKFGIPPFELRRGNETKRSLSQLVRTGGKGNRPYWERRL